MVSEYGEATLGVRRSFKSQIFRNPGHNWLSIFHLISNLNEKKPWQTNIERHNVDNKLAQIRGWTS